MAGHPKTTMRMTGEERHAWRVRFNKLRRQRRRYRVRVCVLRILSHYLTNVHARDYLVVPQDVLARPPAISFRLLRMRLMRGFSEHYDGSTCFMAKPHELRAFLYDLEAKGLLRLIQRTNVRPRRSPWNSAPSLYVALPSTPRARTLGGRK